MYNKYSTRIIFLFISVESHTIYAIFNTFKEERASEEKVTRTYKNHLAILSGRMDVMFMGRDRKRK
jgi:hypothetical protein